MSKVFKIFIIMVLLGALGVMAAGCSQQEAAPPNDTAAPAEEPASGSTGSEPDAASDGAALAQERCSTCHDYDRVEGATKDAAGWDSTIDRMVGHGLSITDGERAAIVEYLATK